MLKRGLENTFIASFTLRGLAFAYSTEFASAFFSSYAKISKKKGISSATHSEPTRSMYACFCWFKASSLSTS